MTDEQRREYYKKYYREHRDIILARNKEWREINEEQYKETRKYSRRRQYRHLKEQGICVYCQKEPAREGRVTCLACKQKNTAYQRNLRERKGNDG